MYYNELKYELRRNSELIEQRDDIFRDIVRHTRSDESKKQTIIDVLNRDIERLNNLNKEHLNIVYKYEAKIKKLKDNLSSEKIVKKELEKIYEDLKNDNEDLLFEFNGMKMINKMLKEDNDKYKQKIKEIEKELEKSEEYINIGSKIKDKKQKDINELTILKDMHEKEIENLKHKINDKEKSINELKDMHEQEIKNLKDQLVFLKKSDQEPKSRKRADQELKSRKIADHQRKGYVDLPILLSKLNINSSKELISNIMQLLNNLYDNKQITKQVYNILNKSITYLEKNL